MTISIITALMLPALAFTEVEDTMKTVALDEVSIVSNIKETGTLRQQPASTTHILGAQLSTSGSGLKAVGSTAPNFFVPDYGSKQTSAIYMRGIGSRIGTPTVGLYVDNVPYYDKTAFDFSFFNVESIDVLRGPQSTLYGRNTMSGLIRVHTFNPFYHTGTDIRLGAATGDAHRQVSVTHYQRLTDKFAFSIGGFYDGSNGFFGNDFTGKNVDAMESAGGRFRGIWKTTERLTLDLSLGYEYSDEGAYPYYYTGALRGDEQYADCVGKITPNLESRYRRGLFNASLNAEYKFDALTLNSVTAFQNINDRMFMDQDFLSADIYSLAQKQKINSISEELLLKNNGQKQWNWLVGANVFYQAQNINAPVTFRKDGVAWLNSVINTNANKYLPPVAAGPMTMNFVFSDNIEGDMLRFDDETDTPVLGAALLHQSTFNNLFGVAGLSASLGLRLDYEKIKMDSKSHFDFRHTYSLNGLLTPMNRQVTMVKEQTYGVNATTVLGADNDYLQVLPKASVTYNFSHGNVYATVSRGYRSGGYNVQNISELLRSNAQAYMMTDVSKATLPVLENQPMVPADAKEKIKTVFEEMSTIKFADGDELCGYKPEYAWNYEAGTHLDFLDRRLSVDFSAFLINVTDLQLSKMSENGLGRTVINAGSSRSMGVELAMRARPVSGLRLGVSYGLSSAKFRDYEVYDDVSKQEIDCHGNNVPFVPANTVSADAAYTMDVKGNILNAITLGADYSLVGKIYWDELNKYSQSSYGLLGAHINLAFKSFELQLWGKNLTGTKYNTFWFESMSRGFEQHGKPMQLGVTLSAHL